MRRISGLLCLLAGGALGTPIDPGRIVSDAMWTDPDTRIELAPGERVTAYARERYVEEKNRGMCPLCNPTPHLFRLSATLIPDAVGKSVQLDMLSYDGELYDSHDILLTSGRMEWQGGSMDTASGTTGERPMDYAALFTWGPFFRFDLVNNSADPVTLVALSASTTGRGEDWWRMSVGANPAAPYVPTAESPEPASIFLMGSAVALLWLVRGRLPALGRR